MTLYEYAKLYQSLGWSIIPALPKNKKPAIAWTQYQSRRSTDQELAAWFNHDLPMNIGLVTGQVSNVVVLDVDDISALRGKSPLPVTPCQKSGRDGHFHFFYRWPGRKVRNFAKETSELHFRGDGGFCVLTPSRHENGNFYEWIIEPTSLIVDVPQWLYDLLEKNGKTIPVTSALDGPYPEGQRNARLASMAGYLRNIGFSEGAIAAALQVENQLRCKPPLPIWEVELVAYHISRYPAGETK